MARPRWLSFVGFLALSAALAAAPVKVRPATSAAPLLQPDAVPSGEGLPPGAVARLGTLRFRHGRAIEVIAFSPDGKVVATGGLSTLRLWETATGKELRRLELDPGTYVTGLTFAPDGRGLAAGEERGAVSLWDVDAGRALRRFLAYPPIMDRDGDTNFRPVTALAYAPGGKWLATGCQIGAPFRLWHAATGRLVREFPLPGVSSGSPALAFSTDGRTLLTRGRRETVSLWEVAGGGQRASFRIAADPGGGGQFAFAPDGCALAWSAYPYEVVRVTDTVTGRQLGQVQGHRAPVTALGMLPQGRGLVTGSQDTTLLVWRGFAAGAP